MHNIIIVNIIIIGTGEQYCGGEESVLLSKEGVLQSPGFPRPYTSNLMCKWTLVAEEYGNHVRLNFSHIVLEKNCDILKICLKNECGEDEKIILTGELLVYYAHIIRLVSQVITDYQTVYSNQRVPQ